MPSHTLKELEERLTAAGNTLLQPPSSLDELLPLLDRTEELLSKVEQSPPKSMLTALSPLMKALVVEELVKHPDGDVRVGVASCISEITRITAPDAPYDDDTMKDVFQLIVSSFENLSDTSSRSHEKRATILETVAKVRSCVIMLDLECDQMIIEMFQHFLKAIRVYHAEVIFASMETIMTLVLEESEDISPDLLKPILSSLKKNNKTVAPIAKKLAKKVIQNCAEKIRPYFAQAVKALDSSVDDYDVVFASLCTENSATIQCSNENILEDQSVVERKSTSASPVQNQVAKDGITETNYQDKDPLVVQSPKSSESNGMDENGAEETMTDANYKEADSNHQRDAGAESIKVDDLSGQTKEVLEAKVEHEEAEQVPYNHEIPSEDTHISPSEVESLEATNSFDKAKDESTQLSTAEEPEDETINVASPTQSSGHPAESQSKKETKSNDHFDKEEILSVDNVSKEASEAENNSEAKQQECSVKKPDDKPANKDKALAEEAVTKNDDGSRSDSEARSLDQSEKLKDTGMKMEDGSSMRKEDIKKGTRSKPRVEKKAPKSAVKEDKMANKDKALVEEAASKNNDGSTSDSEANLSEKLGDAGNELEDGSSMRKEATKMGTRSKPRVEKKAPKSAVKEDYVETANKDKALVEEAVSKKNDGSTSDSEANLSEKLGDNDNEFEDGSSMRKAGNKKSARSKPKVEKNAPKSAVKEDYVKDTVTSPRSPLKSTKDEDNQEETPRMSTKRKRTPGTEKTPETSEYGENLVGSKIEVWWPKDRMFYKGRVASFDSVKKKHKVLYTDGDEEILNLRRERWEFVADDFVSDEDQAVEDSNHDTSTPIKKKGKANSEASSKRGKTEASSKSDLKDTAKRSGGKSKDDGKPEPESKSNSKTSRKTEDDTNKSKNSSKKFGVKIQGDSAKASGRSKDDVAKTSKQDSPRIAKLKGKSPQSGKGNAPQTSSSSKVKETEHMEEKVEKSPETAKGKSADTAKLRESDTKSSKRSADTAKLRDIDTKSGKKRRK